MALIDNEKLYENIEKKLELIKAAKEQPVIMKPLLRILLIAFAGPVMLWKETRCLLMKQSV